jgi:5-dehydro-4-deoxyglucarate dehydratase
VINGVPGPLAEVYDRLDRGMRQGVLSFPLTVFGSDGVDLVAQREHVSGQLAAQPGAIFACCGTGEFFALDEAEYESAVGVAVDEAAGETPVVAGVGYGWPQAARFARAAERAGANALLLMPPYLVDGPQAGVVAHIREVAARTPLPLIVYQRAQVKLSTASVRGLAEIPTVIGVKDGHGDLDQVRRLRLVAPEHWLFFNGVATAEMQAAPYRSVGVSAYSSAVHAFAPEIASAFFSAFQDRDDATTDQLLREFYLPLVELRDKGAGYAVSLIKAGARLRGANVGSVRAPLTDPAPNHLDELGRLIEQGLNLVRNEAPTPRRAQ